MRTYKTFGTPLPVDTMRATNEIINFQSISSNIIRNISLNLTVPSKKINAITRNFVENVHSLIKIKILSVTLEIIIIFCSSKNDLFNKFVIMFS